MDKIAVGASGHTWYTDWCIALARRVCISALTTDILNQMSLLSATTFCSTYYLTPNMSLTTKPSSLTFLTILLYQTTISNNRLDVLHERMLRKIPKECRNLAGIR